MPLVDIDMLSMFDHEGIDRIGHIAELRSRVIAIPHIRSCVVHRSFRNL